MLALTKMLGQPKIGVVTLIFLDKGCAMSEIYRQMFIIWEGFFFERGGR